MAVARFRLPTALSTSALAGGILLVLSGCGSDSTQTPTLPAPPSEKDTTTPSNQPIFPHDAMSQVVPAVPTQSLRVQIFPHVSRYTEPQGKEKVVDEITLTSPGTCQTGGLDPTDTPAAATSPLHFSFASLADPARVSCSLPVTVVRENGLKSYTYDGTFEIKRGQDNQVRVINVLPLEDYLRGVVPSEVFAVWPAETLAAQAVAARSYALFQIGNHTLIEGIAPDVDLDDTVLSQAYLGLTPATATTDKAVLDTTGEIVEFDHHVAVTFFSADAGGYSEDAENVFGPAAQGYCQAKKEPFDTALEPKPWTEHYSLARVTADLENDALVTAANPIADITVDTATLFLSGRVNRVTLKYQDGTSRTISGMKLAGALGLHSTLYSVAKDPAGVGTPGPSFTVTGRGNGHGVGMAQVGAHILAKMGWTHAQILNFYYTDVKLCHLGVDCD